MTDARSSSRGYRTAAALREGIEARLAREADSRGIVVDRFRRHVAFERLLVRLNVTPGSEQAWILKGGFALELRLRDRSRATLDLDLATLEAAHSGRAVHDRLVDALADDVAHDHFNFVVAAPSTLAADRAGRPGWRFSVDVRLAGRTFSKLRMDVVARADEIAGSVEHLRFPSGLAFAGYPPAVTVAVVDIAQHAAEKFHALAQPYGDRTNTRVKDLVDLVLMAETGLIEPTRLAQRVRTVFTVRATHDMPADLPVPAASWTADYAHLIADLDVEARTVDAALSLISPIWKACASDAERD